MGISGGQCGLRINRRLRWSKKMRQFLLAAALIAAPVVAFTGFNLAFVSPAVANATLGDLAPMTTIIADVQKIAATGDFKAAEVRITDFETAWDDAAAGMRPLNPAGWDNIDGAADNALKSLRRGTPTADAVTPALASLLAALTDPSTPVN
jgi:hypothetical protein